MSEDAERDTRRIATDADPQRSKVVPNFGRATETNDTAEREAYRRGAGDALADIDFSFRRIRDVSNGALVIDARYFLAIEERAKLLERGGWPKGEGEWAQSVASAAAI